MLSLLDDGISGREIKRREEFPIRLLMLSLLSDGISGLAGSSSAVLTTDAIAKKR